MNGQIIYQKSLFTLCVYFFGLWTLFLLFTFACDKPNHLSEDKQSDSGANTQHNQNQKQLEQELDWIAYFSVKKKDRLFQLIIENLKSTKITIFAPITDTKKKKVPTATLR